MDITITNENHIINVSQVVETVVQAFPAGLVGNPVDPADYFQTINLFSELNDQTKKTTARQNLELQYIDCGEFN